MPSKLAHQEHIEIVRKKLITAAESTLNGQTRIAESTLAIEQLLIKLDLDMDSEFLVFKGFDSETDSHPFGKQRELWNQDVLQQKDIELKAYEERMKDSIFAACHKLIQRFSKDNISGAG